MEINVDIYANGICCCSVCAPKTMTATEVAHEVNRKNPTGTTHQWAISEDEKFASGEPMPNQCEENENHRHWLLNC